MIDPPARADLAEALDEALVSFTRLVRGLILVEGSGSAAVPGMDWTVADVVAHVTTLHRRGIDDLRRSATADETAALNDLCLREQPVRELATLLELIERDGPQCHAGLSRLPESALFPFHGGTSTSVVPVSGVLLAEYLVHSDDICRATGRSVPPDPDHARLAVLAIAPLLTSWGVPGDPVEVTVRLTDTGDVLTFRGNDDGLTVENGRSDGRASVETDAADWLLAFPFGRRPLPSGATPLAGRVAPI